MFILDVSQASKILKCARKEKCLIVLANPTDLDGLVVVSQNMGPCGYE